MPSSRVSQPSLVAALLLATTCKPGVDTTNTYTCGRVYVVGATEYDAYIAAGGVAEVGPDDAWEVRADESAPSDGSDGGDGDDDGGDDDAGIDGVRGAGAGELYYLPPSNLGPDASGCFSCQVECDVPRAGAGVPTSIVARGDGGSQRDACAQAVIATKLWAVATSADVTICHPYVAPPVGHAARD